MLVIELGVLFVMTTVTMISSVFTGSRGQHA